MTQDNIRKIIRQEKTRQKTTWRALERKTGIALTTLQNYCSGKRNTTVHVLEGLLDALGLELCVRRKRDTS